MIFESWCYEDAARVYLGLTVVLAVSAPAVRSDRPRSRHDPGRRSAAGAGRGASGLEPVSEHPLGELSGLGIAGHGDVHHTRFADVPQVHFVAEPGGARTQLTFRPERVRSVAARPRHDQFLYVIDEGGAENHQLFLQDQAGGEPRRITDGKSRNMAPKWSPSGDLLAWSSNARNGRDMDLYVAAPGDPHFVRLLKEVSGQWTVADWSPDETKVAAVEYISINESYIHIIEIATGKTETITPRRPDAKAEPVSSSDPQWSKDGESLYYLTDKGSEFRRLVHHHLASGTTSRRSRTTSVGRRGIRSERRRHD